MNKTKTLLILLFLICFATQLSAQEDFKEYDSTLLFKKKSILISANFPANPFDFNSVEFFPEVSYSISDNLILGLALSTSNRRISQNENSNKQEDKIHDANIELYVQKYWYIGKKVYVSARPYAIISFGKSVDETSEIINNKNNQITVGIRPGITYKVKDWLFIQSFLGNLSYSYSEQKFNNEVSRSSNNIFSSFRIGNIAITFKIH